MSDTYDDILRNLVNISLNDSLLHQQHAKVMPTRRQSLFSAKSVSSEQLSEDWPFDIWSESTTSKPFRSDRSLSLTESYLSNPGRPSKALEVPPPPGFPPLAPAPSNRYKTELCRSFQEHGSCKYGNKCQFAHGEGELRGLYRHPKYKTEACRTFYNFGYCPYGTRCHFIHEEKLHHTQTHQQHQHQQQHPRLLRQSVSFAGFPGSRSLSPPAPYESAGFARAPSVSPPPPSMDILSPVFGDANREMFAFQPSRRGEVELHGSRKSSCCTCGHGSGLGKENRLNMQRFASDESLSDRESYSSAGSASGSESPTFDGASGKRLTVFARMSVSE